MDEFGETAGPIRAFFEDVAAEFKRQAATTRAYAVLEPLNAGASFEREIVRAKFRLQSSRDVNAAGLIVTADEEETPPNAAASEVARLILQRLEGIPETRKGIVARLEYRESALSELLSTSS